MKLPTPFWQLLLFFSHFMQASVQRRPSLKQLQRLSLQDPLQPHPLTDAAYWTQFPLHLQ